MAPVLGYWDIRGLAAAIRYLLSHANVDYEDKQYVCGPPPSFERQEWVNDKFNLGLDFPNLPYYIDGDVKLSQSQAILRHLARKHGFEGKTEAEKMRVDLAAAQVLDYHMEYARTVYDPNFKTLKETYVKGLPDKLKMLANFLGERKFIAGDYVTFPDFTLFEYLEGQSYLVPGLLDDFPVLDQYHKRMLALEGIDKYFKSPNAIKYPFNGAPSRFGGQYSDQL